MSAYQARAARDAKAGEAAFWTAVAERHPEITTGDLDPLETFAFSEACERVIATEHPQRKRGRHMDTITATFDLERETKGAVRYQERGFDRDAGKRAVGTLYLRKAAVGGAAPAVVRVTIEASA
ncbi:MAG TPA: hypothetical protein VMS45_02660 [Gemmatimonadaceae bacterium]|nr:hypothetical protein [Gemmatimonadaceae bacterium]